MSGLFNMENPFWQALGKLADLMILNICFLICCIPVFTIGAALTGLNYVTLKMHDGEEGYIIKSFFKSFRQNFKQATGMWLITILVAAILVGDILILRDMTGMFYTVLRVIIIIICIACVMVFLYQYAILARFDNTVRNTFRNSFIMAIADFPRTVAMIAIAAAAIVVTFFNNTTLTWALLFWILGGFAIMSYCNTTFLSKIFQKYMPKEESNENPDFWDVDETMGAAPKDTDGETDGTGTEDGNESVEDVIEDKSPSSAARITEHAGSTDSEGNEESQE
ncbi:MAG: YesL family protein [Lachnospiraceae bacterium]|nr:YesL family protein [Lachnospiraceae bacterium]